MSCVKLLHELGDLGEVLEVDPDARRFKVFSRLKERLTVCARTEGQHPSDWRFYCIRYSFRDGSASGYASASAREWAFYGKYIFN